MRTTVIGATTGRENGAVDQMAQTGPSASFLARAFAVVALPSLALHTLLAASAAYTTLWPRATQPSTGIGRTIRPFATLGTVLAGLYLAWFRPWYLRWGATAEEVSQTLPGDDLVANPTSQCTRAITINAPASAVWPWLVQMGDRRGGFYSYDWLERLAGLAVHSADRIVPELQGLQEGDIVPSGPGTDWRVTRLIPERLLVLENWGAFILEPIGEQTTRLIARSRGDSGQTGVIRWLTALGLALCFELPHFIMERKMLLGIKARAESTRAHP